MALDFVAGCLGGCAGILVGHPFDTIKVHLQTQNALRPVYRGTFHCMQTIVQKESVTGLYRGMSSPMGGVALINAVIFGVHGNVQRNMADPDALATHFWAGAGAGLAQSVVCSPIELAKTRLQVQSSRGGGERGRGALQCLAGVARSEGARGLWRGLGATAVRDSAGIAVYFVAYEWLVRAMAPEPGASLSTGSILLAGGLAGTISWVSTFPVDVVKSRLQVDGLDGPRRYAGFWDCCRQSARSEGLAFLGRGLTSTILRAFPVNAATFGVVTWVFRLAGPQAHGQEASSPSPAPAPAPQKPAMGAPLLLSGDVLQQRRQQLAALVAHRRVGAPEGLAACFQASAASCPALEALPDPDPALDLHSDSAPVSTEGFVLPPPSLDPPIDHQQSAVVEHLAAVRRRKMEEEHLPTLTSVS